MAPLNLENSVNVSSLAGTRLGAIFTGLDLLAVLTQLRGLLLYVTAENRRWKERAPGAWASCILIDQMPGNGPRKCSSHLFWLAPTFLSARQVHDHVVG